MMSDLQNLQMAAKGVKLFFVEDNDALRDNASKLFKKLFSDVELGVDGEDALAKFKKHKADLVITDIKMPKMDGIELSKKIKALAPETEILIMSAYDDKDYLLESIKLKVSSFIKKPVALPELFEALQEVLETLRKRKEETLVHQRQEFVFNNQSSMVLMMNENGLELANEEFLDFFAVADLDEFTKKYENVESTFVAEEGYLPPAKKIDWFDGLSENEKKLFHVKIEIRKNNPKHFILNVKRVCAKGTSVLLTFDDISDLKLYEKTQSAEKELGAVQTNPLEFLDVLRRNGGKVHLHNYYKGLSITNDALVSEIVDGKVKVKTNYLQQKAIQYEQKSLILSETFPNAILCERVEKIVFEEQSVEFSQLRFITTSPVLRKTIRVVPEDEHRVTLFVKESIFRAKTSIEDISMDAVKIKANAMPAGLDVGDSAFLDLVLTMDKRAFSMNIEAVLFRQSKEAESFSLVFTFVLRPEQKSELLKYITKRQMAIIREFKGMQHGGK
jgi:CheY-like chemotaxis protein